MFSNDRHDRTRGTGGDTQADALRLKQNNLEGFEGAETPIIVGLRALNLDHLSLQQHTLTKSINDLGLDGVGKLLGKLCARADEQEIYRLNLFLKYDRIDHHIPSPGERVWMAAARTDELKTCSMDPIFEGVTGARWQPPAGSGHTARAIDVLNVLQDSSDLPHDQRISAKETGIKVLVRACSGEVMAVAIARNDTRLQSDLLRAEGHPISMGIIAEQALASPDQSVRLAAIPHLTRLHSFDPREPLRPTPALEKVLIDAMENEGLGLAREAYELGLHFYQGSKDFQNTACMCRDPVVSLGAKAEFGFVTPADVEVASETVRNLLRLMPDDEQRDSDLIAAACRVLKSDPPRAIKTFERNALFGTKNDLIVFARTIAEFGAEKLPALVAIAKVVYRRVPPPPDNHGRDYELGEDISRQVFKLGIAGEERVRELFKSENHSDNMAAKVLGQWLSAKLQTPIVDFLCAMGRLPAVQISVAELYGGAAEIWQEAIKSPVKEVRIVLLDCVQERISNAHRTVLEHVASADPDDEVREKANALVKKLAP